MDDDRASYTAVLICQARAAAHGRIATQRFCDPVAMALLTEQESAVVRRVRDENAPEAAARMDYERVRGGSVVIVPRTVAIDDAVRAAAAPQLVVVGAGLDTRAWRMPELSTVDVFEVDHPATQQDKRARLGDRRPLARSVRFVPVDFTRDELGPALEQAGHRADRPTMWLWEGVVVYLRRAEVATTLAAMAQRSAAGSRLVVNYQAPSARAFAGRLLVRALHRVMGEPSSWAREPWRSTWTPGRMARLLARHGFAVERDADLYEIAEQLPMPISDRGSLHSGRIVVAGRRPGPPGVE
ncbi:MAG: SAM-dependent methyltransferase [Micromonosporaceae bacterium]|nr:SAM-dependent methyltransferase [Micromonosporaceae bacterium]